MLEYVNSCLFDFVTAQASLAEPTAKLIFRQISHGDLKEENVLLSVPTLTAKLCDFGHAGSLWDSPTSVNVGTLLYTPPEYLILGQLIKGPADIYCLGILLYAMLRGRLPFLTDAEIMHGGWQELAGAASEVTHLLHSCLAREAHLRPNADELMDHRWFFTNR